MRYHFLSFRNEFYDFKPTADYVLDKFLKKSLKKRQTDLAELSGFVKGYVLDLAAFFRSFLELVQRVCADARYYKLFCILGISTHLYPLIVRLQARALLDQPIAEDSHLTFADLIETIDVRVYKTRGTDPAKDISHLACDASTAEPDQLRKRMGDIAGWFMEDAKFESHLLDDMYANAAILHVLLEQGEAWAKAQGKPAYTVDHLKNLMRANPTIEHVFAQTPAFNFPSRGFATTEEYMLRNDRIGNLCILEKELNSRCQNRPPEQKLEDVSLYKQSHFDTTKALVAEVAASGANFEASSIDDRTRKLAAFARRRWPLWNANTSPKTNPHADTQP
jgi:hypothetical protein